MEESQNVDLFKKRLKNDRGIQSFPVDLWREVIKFLPQTDIIRILRVCKLWKLNIGQIILRWESPKGKPSIDYLCRNFPNLEHLFCSATFTDEFTNLSNLRNLRHLELKYESDFWSNNTIHFLSTLSNLEIFITNYPFNSSSIVSVSSLQRLHTLTFEGASLIEVPSSQLCVLSSLTALRFLSMRELPSNDMSFLSHLTQLRSLHEEFSLMTIPDDQIIHLNSLQHLTSLCIVSEIKTNSILKLKPMEELHSLTLNIMTPELVNWLFQCPKLTELRFTHIHPDISTLDIALPTIKNFACHHWEGRHLGALPILLPNLEIIVFGDPDQIDFAVEVSDLKHFDLNNTIANPTRYFNLFQFLQVLFVDGHVLYINKKL